MGIERSPYGMRVRISRPYEAAVAAARDALKQQGFGVLTEIDVRKVLQEKLNREFRRYVILGACNPEFSHEALSAELEIGLLLPCNAIVYEEGEGSVVAAMDPAAALGAITQNPQLLAISAEVRERLRLTLEAVVS